MNKLSFRISLALALIAMLLWLYANSTSDANALLASLICAGMVVPTAMFDYIKHTLISVIMGCYAAIYLICYAIYSIFETLCLNITTLYEPKVEVCDKMKREEVAAEIKVKREEAAEIKERLTCPTCKEIREAVHEYPDSIIGKIIMLCGFLLLFITIPIIIFTPIIPGIIVMLCKFFSFITTTPTITITIIIATITSTIITIIVFCIPTIPGIVILIVGYNIKNKCRISMWCKKCNVMTLSPYTKEIKT